MDDLGHQVLKEWYWLVIMAALIGVFFAPSILKAKCPRCGKRKMVSVEIDNNVRKSLEAKHPSRQFLTFYTCGACGSRLFRERTGPFEDAHTAGLDAAFNQAAPAEVPL